MNNNVKAINELIQSSRLGFRYKVGANLRAAAGKKEIEDVFKREMLDQFTTEILQTDKIKIEPDGPIDSWTGEEPLRSELYVFSRAELDELIKLIRV
ncbi:hypothetical protein [Paenibacillus glucanolyticus]|uniref:hypothetical protein n=1 Tax=Paenibacillus glucanolyticus TaxID=59843 RepID=UPI0030CE544A